MKVHWSQTTLALAAAYNLVWGAVAMGWPDLLFRWLKLDPPRPPVIWQCVGMLVGVYGVGYAIAARNPNRHWPIVLVGWLGKVAGPIGYLAAARSGQLPWRFGLINLTNDLIWLPAFTAMLARAARQLKVER